MKKIVLFLVVIATFFVSCKKDVTLPSPTDATRIQSGTWSPLIPANPEWNYEFERGILIQSLPAFSTVLITYTFPYAIRADTVLIGGDTTNQPRRWVCYFHCDSLVEVTQLGAAINEKFFLKRNN